MTRIGLRVTLLLAVLVLATACGGSGEPPPAAPAQAPSQTPSQTPETVPTGAPAPTGRPVPSAPDPLVATPPPGGTVVPADRVDATAVPPGFPTLVWTRGPRTLGVYGRGGGCTDARAELTGQDATTVSVRVVQFSTGTGPCTRELRYPPLEVSLDADLGTRRVVLRGDTP